MHRPPAAPGAGRRRSNSATAACLRALALASTRSHAQITPTSSSSDAPAVPVTVPGRLIRRTGPAPGRPARRPAVCRRRTPRPGWCTHRGTWAPSPASPGPAAGRHRAERGPHPGPTSPGHLRPRRRLTGGELPDPRDQRSQLRIIHPRRRRIIRILMLLHLTITGIILTLRRQVTRLIHPLRPLRARRNQPPIRGAELGIVHRNPRACRTGPRPARGPGEPVLRSSATVRSEKNIFTNIVAKNMP